MTDSDKICQLQKYLGCSWRQLAQVLGFSSPQTFTDIAHGRRNISQNLTERLLAEYPQISRKWLTLGEGEMIVPVEERTANANVPDIRDFFPSVTDTILYTSSAMTEYPVGCTLFLKEINDKTCMMYGANYLIETPEFKAVRRVQKGDSDNTITLYATNGECYPDGRLINEPVNISLDSVSKAYAVLGYVLSTDGKLS